VIAWKHWRTLPDVSVIVVASRSLVEPASEPASGESPVLGAEPSSAVQSASRNES
jgi:hypothetical protein